MNACPGPERPLPKINPIRCDGCGLCVRVCPTQALGIVCGMAVTVRPEACAYHGYCERICPTQAIECAFQIIVEE